MVTLDRYVRMMSLHHPLVVSRVHAALMLELGVVTALARLAHAPADWGAVSAARATAEWYADRALRLHP